MKSFYQFMKEKVELYYRERAGIGRDFFTAPELDRIFGFALAEKIIPLLESISTPNVVELGAGRGLMAKDILQFVAERKPTLYERLSYRIYETSPLLREFQGKVLQEYRDKVMWLDRLEIPEEAVVISNEFFDCLPVHVVKEGKELYLKDKEKVWLPCDERVKQFLRRMGYENIKTVVEVCLECIDLLKRIADSMKRGYILTIDYGYTSQDLHRYPEGTVVGYKEGRVYYDIFSEDLMDLSAMVNFSALVEWGEEYGLRTVFLKKQRHFLLESQSFVDELTGLSMSEKPEDIERLSRLKTMLISMGDRFWVLLQAKGV
ncbi:protein of unknown function DUF185 [Thermocrinis albus DSM 14484]|uniref:SAM-dependent methyltransferase n=1 Tax=Thermocrinis albus (strain DSM 14484 / JCM 11386 / HI 11/12) TaxID=638303 RepID=D3SPZ1_THEAH|nr:SAM-dependent methyltransferase [Thermocrinis albus]ADC89228.1 protein of unknown function DUF185 [Thermocrinis albus DSM 14484]